MPIGISNGLGGKEGVKAGPVRWCRDTKLY
jgi:hypothetical protein